MTRDLRSASRLAALFLTTCLAAGCSTAPAGGKTTLTGKVTLSGQPVAGILVFLGSGGKEVGSAPIAVDGTYTATDLPKGTLAVLVRPIPSPIGPAQRGMKMAGMDQTRSGVNPPTKYTRGAGLTVAITDGRNAKDFPLTP